MFQARRTCLPGGVQGNEFYPNDYVSQFNCGMREVICFLIRAVTALQEAESFPAVQNSRDCLWDLGVSSRFGVPGLFSAVFPLTTVCRTSLSIVPNGCLAGCRGRQEAAACALPQADQKTGKLHSTQLVDRSGMTFFERGGVRSARSRRDGSREWQTQFHRLLTFERQVLGDGRPECECENERGAMISREE